MSVRMIAIAALMAGLTADGVARGQSQPSLQSRLEALTEQVHLRYQHYEPALTAHRQQIQAVLIEWNRVTGGEASAENKRLLTEWLNASLRAVMPGGSDTLPAAPRFIEQPEPVIAAPAPKAAPAERSVVKASVEPMRAPAPAPQATETIRTQADHPPVYANGPTQRTRPSQPERRSAAKPVAPEATAEGPSRTPSRSKWSRHPSAAPLEWRDPFVDDPAASPNPLRTGKRRTSLRPTSGRSAGVTVNRAQLAAEVRGYNGALRELQIEVIGLAESDLFGLAAAAERLEQLEQQRQFLDLYREGLPASERGWLPDSPSAELVREMIRRKADRLAEQTPPQEKSRRRALESLTARLARLEGLSER